MEDVWVCSTTQMKQVCLRGSSMFNNVPRLMSCHTEDDCTCTTLSTPVLAAPPQKTSAQITALHHQVCIRVQAIRFLCQTRPLTKGGWNSKNSKYRKLKILQSPPKNSRKTLQLAAVMHRQKKKTMRTSQ